VTSDQIAPAMKQAIVDIEDARFYEHGALDLRGTPVGNLQLPC
jgi:membrane peptidoglycan carboxypeptidase